MENTINEIKDLIARIKDLQDSKDNISIDDLDMDKEEIFASMLDECYEKVTVCGIEFLPSDILFNCDPVAFRCYCNDYISEIDIENLSEYQDVISNIDSEIDDIKYEIKDIIDNL